MKLRKTELWAIVITAVFLAAAAGYHAGARQSAPSFRVTASGPARAETGEETGEAGIRLLTEAGRQDGAPAAGAAAQSADGPVDINAAGAEELKEALSGVGDVLAERIVAYREEHGPFRRVEDITKVSGIGAKILESNLGRMTVKAAEEDER